MSQQQTTEKPTVENTDNIVVIFDSPIAQREKLDMDCMVHIGAPNTPKELMFFYPVFHWNGREKSALVNVWEEPYEFYRVGTEQSQKKIPSTVQRITWVKGMNAPEPVDIKALAEKIAAEHKKNNS